MGSVWQRGIEVPTRKWLQRLLGMCGRLPRSRKRFQSRRGLRGQRENRGVLLEVQQLKHGTIDVQTLVRVL